jgi:YegS/Rv2252/BmrU family lipid kinase
VNPVDEGQPHDRRETLFIVNPAAHNLPSPKALRAAEAWLHQQGWQAAWEETQRPGDAITMAARAAKEKLPLVFIVGGDGTLNEAANGLASSETALATVPAGTVNIWAHEVGIPREPLAAVRACLGTQRRRIDLGRAGDRYFLLMAGYGLDGHIAHQVPLQAKRYVGAASYAMTAVRASLSYRGRRVTLSLDGQRQEGRVLMLVAANTRNYAGLADITAAAKVDDGLLDVCVFLGDGFPDIVMHTLRVALRRHRKSSRVIYRKGRRLELEWEEPLPLQLDGDALGESPTRIEVVPQVLEVMAPRGPKCPLFSR